MTKNYAMIIESYQKEKYKIFLSTFKPLALTRFNCKDFGMHDVILEEHVFDLR